MNRRYFFAMFLAPFTPKEPLRFKINIKRPPKWYVLDGPIIHGAKYTSYLRFSDPNNHQWGNGEPDEP